MGDSHALVGLGRNIRGGTRPEAVMGPLGVVPLQPGRRLDPDPLQRGEEMRIEHLRSVGPVEAFDEGVLVGLAGLNEAQRDALGGGPLLGPSAL
jgi:hypothetical protein